MLNLFLFETLRFIHGTVLDRTLVVANSLLLLHTSLVKLFTLHLFLVSLLLAMIIFVVSLNDVALTDFQDVLSLLLSLFNFLPRLLLLSLQKGNTVSQNLNVFRGFLARNSLVGKSRCNRSRVVLNLLALFAHIIHRWIFGKLAVHLLLLVLHFLSAFMLLLLISLHVSKIKN